MPQEENQNTATASADRPNADRPNADRPNADRPNADRPNDERYDAQRVETKWSERWQQDERKMGTVGITARATGGFGDINVEGLEKRQGYWVNRDHERDPVMIHLNAKGGVGEIRIVAE